MVKKILYYNMYIDRHSHWQFLEDEMKAETEEFNKKFMTTAISLLINSEEMFVAQFVTFKDGEMIMKFPNTRSLPRKGEFLMCMVLPPNLQNYRNWGKLTYRDLYKQRYNSTEAVCIWHSSTNDKNFSLVGFRRVSIDFAEYIKEVSGIILVFGPQRPPIDYLMNLQRIVEDKSSPNVSSILDNTYFTKEWTPILINHDNVSNFVYNQLSLTDTMIIQGPPGTGKTYMISELCKRLCKEGFSVLVTALTNRALMEIAEKPAVASLLNEGKIFKTNITIDEHRENSKLEPIKHIVPIPSAIILSTYYITSGFAADLSFETPFDYIIVDEASQALLAMFAASKKIGKHNLWVGDIHQLSPIIALNRDRVRISNYKEMINGLQLLTNSSSSPIYQLSTTYRFGQRAANYTGIFYNGTIVAKTTKYFTDLPSIQKILFTEGGPTLVLTDMPSGEYTPQFALMLTTYIVGSIIRDVKDKKIAVLTCMKNTTRALQKVITQNIGSMNNIIIETIARIQGLTTDVTVFFVPNTSYIRTLEPNLFNVATSRAKEHTIIIADKNLLEYPTITPYVRCYLERLKSERYIYIPAQKNINKYLEQNFMLEE